MSYSVGYNSQSPLQYIKGVGPKRAEALANLGIHSIKDLFHITLTVILIAVKLFILLI